MEGRIERDVEGWPTRPFEDGYEGLRQLASADFSGVVRAAGTWLFFVNGKIVGVFEGEIDTVEDAQGTAHKAPHPSLPLLYAMQATGGETRAKYYTNDTPISDVNDTLSSGSFTGYVELSENVLSGDYYQLYHGGRSMSVAFVGNSGKMITGDDAFERADDEVGIYEVVDVDVQVTDVPQPAGGTDATAAEADESAESDATGTAATAGDTTDDSASDAAATADDAASVATTAAATTETSTTAETEAATSTDTAAETDETPDVESNAAASDDAAATVASDADDDASAGDETSETASSTTGTARDTSAGTDTGSHDTAASESGATGADSGSGTESRSASSTRTSAETGRTAGESDSRSDRGSTTDATPAVSESTAEDAGGADGEPRLENEAAWREATTVPSLDPDRSEDGQPDEAGSGTRQRGRRTQSRQQSKQRSRERSRTESRQRQSNRERSADGQATNVDDTLEEEVLEREDRIDRLQQRVENFEEEREELAEERDQLAERVESLTEENESLRGEIRQLEQEIEELEAASASGSAQQAGGSGTDGASGGGPLAPRAALEGTDLFVRYDSKSAPTLDAAHDGSADAASVNQNLRLDVHTQFEETGATVDGEPFETFLQGTMAYRFVEWLVRTLPYEVRETNSQSDLRDLYDAVPEIDRVEFHGEVAREALEGEEGAPSETFDVVVRDKMGEALLVANMNESRDPATGRMIVDLQEAASRVKKHSLALAGAFFVTRSFFEPAALETASEATSGSLLSRDSRRSYVKLSRKQGYHLCLVEARGDDLHLNVPEL